MHPRGYARETQAMHGKQWQFELIYKHLLYYSLMKVYRRRKSIGDCIQLASKIYLLLTVINDCCSIRDLN